MSINLNNVQPQASNDFELIPDGTIAPVRMSVRGEKLTKAGDARMLDVEFVVTAGSHARRKIWANMMITSNGSTGHDTAVNITMGRVRAFVESAYGLTATDDSPEAMAARELSDWSDLDGLEFVAKIGIEKSKDPQYSDKNAIVGAIGPGSDDYRGFTPAKPKRKPASVPAPATNGAAASGGSRPAWA